MNSLFIKSLICTLALLLLPLSPVLAKKDLPEVDKDGLHLLKDSKARVVYTKPGASLDKYTKVKILDCYVAFRKGY